MLRIGGGVSSAGGSVGIGGGASGGLVSTMVPDGWTSGSRHSGVSSGSSVGGLNGDGEIVDGMEQSSDWCTL